MRVVTLTRRKRLLLNLVTDLRPVLTYELGSVIFSPHTPYWSHKVLLPMSRLVAFGYIRNALSLASSG